MTVNELPPSGVACSGIRFRYGDRVALDDVSLHAPPGSVLGLIGPNGAGKTTLIRVLTTVLPLQEGRFHVAGCRHTDPSGIRPRIGVLPESGGYPRGTTARDYLILFARLYGYDRFEAAARARRLLSEVGLAERGADRIKTFSRGMRQRLGLARALVNDPIVLFLDEPTLGLDPAGQAQVVGVINEAARRRRATVLLTSHLLEDVERVCDELVVLDRGRVVGGGSVADVARSDSGSIRLVLDFIPADRDRALRLLAGDGRQVRATTDPGRIDITARQAQDGSLNDLLAPLLAAGVRVLRIETGPGSLRAAFMRLTEDE